jgi:hypothetical protein
MVGSAPLGCCCSRGIARSRLNRRIWLSGTSRTAQIGHGGPTTFYRGTTRWYEIHLISQAKAAEITGLFLTACVSGFAQWLIALGEPGAEPAAMPLLRHRGQVEECATAYVCIDFACRPPVNDPHALRTLVEQ